MNFPRGSCVSIAKAIEITKFLLWMILFVVCWPAALLALVLYPFVWLVLLPFRLVGIVGVLILESILY